ncbi:sugar (and other) transporter [Cordyceps javanica]|uniref:Sugar (And other) transporter n=1 Tax=Cordyceps javanica TaxID=43265 RepID=A0A545V3P7_9HYPO|nr:sugar (and other) transporter [Cordyceps javanica]TQW07647.1 Sugar (and other) transporter [Cordyceps javanica]
MGGIGQVQEAAARSTSQESTGQVAEKTTPVQERVVHGNEAFNEALLREPPRAWAPSMVMVYLFSVVGFLCSTMNGYDASLINNLLQNRDFRDTYDVGADGLGAGLVAAMYQIGGVAVLPFVGPVIDRFGRRAGMGAGAALVIVGTIVQGTAAGGGGGGARAFMGGRFLLGFGVGLAASAGPMYVVEINHPAYRGVVGAVYNCLWLAGAILAAGAARGSLAVSAAFSWRLITWLQCLFSGVVVLLCPFVPESPRWLYVNGRRGRARARAFLVRYHGAGDPDSVWPALQMREYEEALDLDGADKRWYDYGALFRDRASAYRLVCSVSVAALSQWLGNAVLSYFLGSVLYNAGFTEPIQQSNITLANNVIQFVCACCGAVLVDRVGRRPLLIFSFAACTVVWLGMTIASSQFAASYAGESADHVPIYTNANASRASLAMIFLFGAVFSIGITPLQGLYIVEVLSFEQRAKGMAFGNLAVNAAGLLNQFAWPVSMAKIGWRTYIIFIIWDAIMTVYMYFILPETKGRTLEELDEIFAAKNPVKASVAKKKLAITQQGQVVDIAEA